VNQNYSLRQLGWQPYYQQQLSLEEYEQLNCARITAHHRSEYVAQLETKQIALPINKNLPAMTVGDWVLLDLDNHFVRQLDRHSLFSRKGAGSQIKQQHISANIDTLFIVSSLNQDFNLSRLERYLALAHDAEVEPVVVLTKTDLCQDAKDKAAQVQVLDPLLRVLTVNGLLEQAADTLSPWCKTGKTVSFVGSSGVGKSTLINRLLGQEIALTSGIREDDDKGKHTTTARALFISENKGVIIDTPGMRELQLIGCEEGIQNTFADIEALAKRCRFNDCHHVDEPNCAVLQAIENQALDSRRLNNYQKLLREQAYNNASLKQQKDKGKQLSKMYKRVLSESVNIKRGY
jgi:ribosome biogenesis GTPase